jgi:hypothetical protein
VVHEVSIEGKIVDRWRRKEEDEAPTYITGWHGGELSFGLLVIPYKRHKIPACFYRFINGAKAATLGGDEEEVLISIYLLTFCHRKTPDQKS